MRSKSSTPYCCLPTMFYRVERFSAVQYKKSSVAFPPHPCYNPYMEHIFYLSLLLLCLLLSRQFLKIILFFYFKSKSVLKNPGLSILSCSISDFFPFSQKIIPSQNSQNASFSSKIIKKPCLKFPSTPESLK